jgi:mRNA interferase RelE/StbE
MAKVDGLDVVLDFLKNLQPKIVSQIARKILGLSVHPFPPDASALIGYPALFRVDSGEYRIVYTYDKGADTVTVLLVGKRNDDEIYRKLSRLSL